MGLDMGTILKNAMFWRRYDLRDLVLTPDQIRLRLNIFQKCLIYGGCTSWMTWPSLQVKSIESYSVHFEFAVEYQIY